MIQDFFRRTELGENGSIEYLVMVLVSSLNLILMSCKMTIHETKGCSAKIEPDRHSALVTLHARGMKGWMS